MLSLEDIKIIQSRVLNAADAFIIRAMFEGVEGKGYEEIYNLKISDIKGNELHLCTGKIKKVSEELIELAHEAYAAEYYYSYGESGRNFKYDVSENIIKPLYNTRFNTKLNRGRVMLNTIRRCLNHAGYEWVKGSNINDSGKIHYINSRCNELNIDARTFLYNEKYYQEFVDKFSDSFSKNHFIDKYYTHLV